uniref:Uncharacterized protein n=1 Tax=Rhizophora mucronata TaxID=61149 RepID=A0A2P2LR08_RHIMU
MGLPAVSQSTTPSAQGLEPRPGCPVKYEGTLMAHHLTVYAL